MKIGDLVRYKGGGFPNWLGYIVKEIPGMDHIKVVDWWDGKGNKERSSHPAAYLELEVVKNEDR